MIHQLDRAVAGLWMGIFSFGAGTVTIAQGILDAEAVAVERYLGGGALIVVAVLIVRWSRQMTHEVRATLATSLEQVQSTLDHTVKILGEERDAWRQERETINAEREQLRHELMETHTLLTEERALRLSLEKAGLADRRNRD